MIYLRPTTPSSAANHSDAVWPQLRQGIAKSSGFKRWAIEHGLETSEGHALDKLVRLYLRQALETLAY